MVAALKIGFDKVFDTNFSADYIMEEVTEFLHRVTTGGTLPMITSCSPGWIRFCEMKYPDLLDHLSTCKSPQQMFGALVKTYYAEKVGIDPKKIICVSVMPCTSKKTEAARPEMKVDGIRDVDIVLTTRELGDMIKQARINFLSLADEDPDSILGDIREPRHSEPQVFIAASVPQRTSSREDLKSIEYRGSEGWPNHEASVTLPVNGTPTEIKVAVAHGTANAAKVLDAVRAGKADYHFIEVMACPGGCVHGGGQSHVSSKARLSVNPRENRANALYSEDVRQVLRKSHENPEVKKLYEDYLKEPNGELSHKLLHTHYHKREVYCPQE